MKRVSLTWAVAVVALIVAGCGGSGTSSNTTSSSASSGAAPATPAATPPAGEGHAAGIVPGSYEDWCAEHGVPETQCTRCDPSLIPAFKAANDWDEEHGLPMSQCTIHNPNLKIVRPPKPEGK
jgi:hypothetical protein